jgi:hypothetical protein
LEDLKLHGSYSQHQDGTRDKRLRQTRPDVTEISMISSVESVIVVPAFPHQSFSPYSNITRSRRIKNTRARPAE